MISKGLKFASEELPPRTRRILADLHGVAVPAGTTSAHAENTEGGHRDQGSPGNYLRARGEYNARNTSGKKRGELPPRTRRILGPLLYAHRGHGTTSAHAENTAI